MNFVLAKIRLAPLRNILTIPKLELQAAVAAVRLKTSIIAQLPSSKIVFWSDSKTVLNYIRNENRKFPPFVMHRVAEICEYSQLQQWSYFPDNINPADISTRPKSFSQLKSSTWLHGPAFLCQTSEIPNFEIETDNSKDEVKVQSTTKESKKRTDVIK